MRRILVEQARRKATLKRGGERERQRLEPDDLPVARRPAILSKSWRSTRRWTSWPRSRRARPKLVKLRYFAG